MIPQETLYPLSFTPFIPPKVSSSSQPLIYFISLRFCQFWTFYMRGIIPSVFFYDWHLSLSTMFSRFIHVVANVITYSFLMLNNISLYRHKLHFVYPWTCGHRDCFYFLDIMKNATMNIHIQVLLWTCVFISLGYIGVEFLYHVVTL